jgi:hypothetical protein
MVGWRVGEIERFLANPSRYRAPRISGDVDQDGGDHDGR